MQLFIQRILWTTERLVFIVQCFDWYTVQPSSAVIYTRKRKKILILVYFFGSAKQKQYQTVILYFSFWHGIVLRSFAPFMLMKKENYNKSLFFSPVDWGCRIHQLHLSWGVRSTTTTTTPTSILNKTLNSLIVRLQECWSFGECRVLFHCHHSQVHSDQSGRTW